MSHRPSSSVALGEGDEFDAIRAMLRVWGARATGIGDDAALVTVPDGEQLVVSTDASMEQVHFRRGWLTAREIGARATAAALSDLAAMAATPLGLLLALGVPSDWREELDEITHGVGEMAASHDCSIIGGNVTRASELSLTITVLGSTARPLARDRASAGDVLYVTGELGGPGAALAALLRGDSPRAEHRDRFASPRPRIAEARWLAEHGARAAIDISDGLLADAGHLASASDGRLELDATLLPCLPDLSPEQAATSGEEYELLVACSPELLPDPATFRDAFGIPLTRIGRVTTGAGAHLSGMSGRVDLPRGHDHFS